MGRVTVNRSGSSCGFRSVGYTFQVFSRLLTYQLFKVTMSMFSGLTNQISGWVANKTGQGDPNADPNAQQAPGGIGGMAMGFMGKAMAAKDGLKEKAAGFQPPNLGNLGGGVLGNITQMIPGQRREEEVPNPPEQGVDPNAMVDPNQMVDPNAMQYQQYDQQQYQQ